ncbi:MAG TPA: glycosyltransferase family 2 protein [Nevskiaceae bacterium]|nr:glycosyltransferase family 2 protein [Nevskiaceae bacterium]
MSEAPLVSVIIPTHNRAPLLSAAIESVLAQSYEKLELIVVDDASTDHTPDVVHGFKDPRLQYLRMPQNRRAAAARNAGIAKAKGSLIAFNDDDDLWLVQKLEKQVAQLQAEPSDVGLNLGGYIRYWDRAKNFADYVGGPYYFRNLDFSHGFVGEFSLIATPGWLARREALEKAGGFDERMKCWDDWELAARLWRSCRFTHLDEPVFIQDRARTMGGGMWDNAANYANDYRIIIERHAPEWSQRVRRRHQRTLARVAAKQADAAPRKGSAAVDSAVAPPTEGPLVSVILATYRRGHVIGRALKSVLAQSYRNLEVIVLDDVPNDNTEAVVRSFDDPRVRYVAYPDRRGVAAARNQGISLARGKYLAFQDSDDEWLAGKLAWQVQRMEAQPEDVALTQAAVLRFQGQGTEAEYYISDLPRGHELEAILTCNMTSFTQAWLLRRSVLDEVGSFDERLPLWEDWELLIRICEKYGVDIDPRPAALVYDTPGGLTAQGQARPPAFRLIIERHRKLMERHPSALADNLYLLGLMEVAQPAWIRFGRQALSESLRLGRRTPKAIVLLLVAQTGSWLPRFISTSLRRLRGVMWTLRRHWYRRTEPFQS